MRAGARNIFRSCLRRNAPCSSSAIRPDGRARHFLGNEQAAFEEGRGQLAGPVDALDDSLEVPFLGIVGQVEIAEVDQRRLGSFDAG